MEMGNRLHIRFAKDQRGTVLVETLIVLPVLTLLTFGILEFGNLMWQRQQLQIGVRDAARYWSRCRPNYVSTPATCTEAIARNIAFTGHPDGDGYFRVNGWGDDNADLVVTPSQADLASSPDIDDFVVVQGTVVYLGSPVFSAVFGDDITIGYWATMRYYGW